MSLSDWKYTGSNNEPYSVISVRPINHSFSAHYDSTSYGLIGAICITEARVTGKQEVPGHASGFELGESYPNPFSNTTVIEYTLPHPEKVTIKVFDLYGREIKTLVDKVVQPGIYQIEWNANKLPGRIYLYRMQAGKFAQTGKTILIK